MTRQYFSFSIFVRPFRRAHLLYSNPEVVAVLNDLHERADIP